MVKELSMRSMGKYCLPLISKPLNCKKVMKRQGRLPILLFALFFCAPSLYAHGGRTIDQDRCVFRTGGMLMHFTAYQPSTSVKDELCRELPSTNSTIVIIDLVDEALRNIPINIVVKREAVIRYSQQAQPAFQCQHLQQGSTL